MHHRQLSYLALVLVVAGCSSGTEDPDPVLEESSQDALPELSGPTYTASGELVRRADWTEWVFLGASLNLSYSEEPPPADFFANVFMEPSAFAHFKRTGEFRDGTMTVAAGYLASGDAEPAEQGQFAGEAVLFEMSVRDSTLDAAVPWRYYSFGEDATAAPANPREACFDCHTEHAATDHVFTQFYPVLRDLTGSD
jgi:hypothetical protein